MANNYQKQVEMTDTGMVVGEVWATHPDDRRVGLAFFHWPPFFPAYRLRRAHRWADKLMKICAQHEEQRDGHP